MAAGGNARSTAAAAVKASGDVSISFAESERSLEELIEAAEAAG